MYIIHDNDGTIHHSVGGPDKTYGKTLTDAGQQWIFLEGEFAFNPVTQFVDVEKKAAGAAHPDCLCEKCVFVLTTDKTEIVADGTDTATISGVPAGARVTIRSDARIEFDDTVDDGRIELSAATPTIYIVRVTPAGARYIPTSIQVVAK